MADEVTINSLGVPHVGQGATQRDEAADKLVYGELLVALLHLPALLLAQLRHVHYNTGAHVT